MITDKEVIRSLRSSKFFLNVIWPFLRLFVVHKLSNRCRLCTQNERSILMKDSVCSTCSSKQKTDKHIRVQNNTKKKELHDLMMSLPEQRNSLYDVILLFSGGKDSIYILYKLVTDYPALRILALTIDNGFRSPIGKNNTTIICDYFNVDHMEIRPYEAFSKLYKFGFENFSNRGFICTDFFEGELFQDIGRNIAASLNCKMLLLGYTPDQLNSIPDEFNTYNLYSKDDYIIGKEQMFTRKQYCGINLSDIFTDDEMEYWWDYTRYDKGCIPKVVFPFVAWGYNREEIEEEILSLGILQNIDPMLTNDLYCTIGIYLDYKILGYSTIESEWAKQVRDGHLNRKLNRNMWELVEYISNFNENLFLKSADFVYAINRLNLNISDLKNIIKKSL